MRAVVAILDEELVDPAMRLELLEIRMAEKIEQCLVDGDGCALAMHEHADGETIDDRGEIVPLGREEPRIEPSFLLGLAAGHGSGRMSRRGLLDGRRWRLVGALRLLAGGFLAIDASRRRGNRARRRAPGGAERLRDIREGVALGGRELRRFGLLGAGRLGIGQAQGDDIRGAQLDELRRSDARGREIGSRLAQRRRRLCR